MKFNSKEIIANSKILFGTSGARGLVSDFSINACAAFTSSFAKLAQTRFDFDKIAIGIDNRPSSYKMAQSCAAALSQMDINPVYYGVLPTPALAHQAMSDSMPAIMITGSHIPFDRNGIKFYFPDGEIAKSDEDEIYKSNVFFKEIDELPILFSSDDASNNYIKRYCSLYSPDTLNGKRIGIYEHSSAGRDIYSKIFSSLGATVFSLGRSDVFVPIDTEAVSEFDRGQAKKWSMEYNLDAIFSTDGDGDRPLLADEHGEWLRGDILGIIAARSLNIEAVSTPINCNSGIYKYYNCDEIALTKIGSPYVIEGLLNLKRKFTSVAGFEANGGFLLGSDIFINNCCLTALPTRDAVLPAITLLTSSKSISMQLDELPSRFTFSDRLQNFPDEKSNEIISLAQTNPDELINMIGITDSKVKELDTTDGVRITLSNENIIHLRKSGNAPELRCYSESNNLKSAEELVRTIFKKIDLM